jgi:hypothetical protein
MTFNYPLSPTNQKGAVLAYIGSDNMITVIKFPANTSFTASTLRTASGPAELAQTSDAMNAGLETGDALAELQGL